MILQLLQSRCVCVLVVYASICTCDVDGPILREVKCDLRSFLEAEIKLQLFKCNQEGNLNRDVVYEPYCLQELSVIANLNLAAIKILKS